VRSHQQLVERFAFNAEGRSADANADAGFAAAANLERKLRHGSLDAIPQLFDLRSHELLHDSDKLIARVARQEVVLAQLRLNYSAHLAQHLVAGFVTKRVVDQFE